MAKVTVVVNDGASGKIHAGIVTLLTYDDVLLVAARLISSRVEVNTATRRRAERLRDGLSSLVPFRAGLSR